MSPGPDPRSGAGPSPEARPYAFAPLTPVSFLRRAAEVHAGRTAVVDEDFSCTYAQLWDRSQRMAGLLCSHGVRPGDRVCLLAPNTHMALEAHYGVPLAGAVLVALNTRLAAVEIAYILDHSGARAVLVDGTLTGLLDEALGLAAGSPEVVVSGRYDTEVTRADPVHLPVADERGLLSLNYTSGTTGRPKGVMYHHRGAYLTALAMAFHTRMDQGSRYLWTLPMFHTNGWCFPWTVTAAGAEHHCLRGIDPPQVWRRIAAAGITHLCAAPTVLAMLARHPSAAAPSRPVEVFSGGAPPWPALLEQLAGLGLRVHHLYGLTETFGPALLCEEPPEWERLPPTQRAARLARQGVPNLVGEPVRLLDAEGRDVPPDGTTPGEIALRGNNVMLGYYRPDASAAEESAEATSDGWFRTGDLAVRDPDGYVRIQDRLKDVIISGGENISSVEVENALTRHPAVSAAAVVAAPHPHWGEVPVAFVECRPGAAVTEEEIRTFARAQLTHFKVPHTVVLSGFPVTSTGKPRKDVLRTRAAALVPPRDA